MFSDKRPDLDEDLSDEKWLVHSAILSTQLSCRHSQ